MGKSSENLSVPSDKPLIFNISSNEININTENPIPRSENAFDSESLENTSPNINVTDTSSSESDKTYLYDSFSGNSWSSESFREVYFNQNDNCNGKISIYYTNCDRALNKREKLTLQMYYFNPDVGVLTEIFP